jgi:hypothetical protein
MAVFFVTYTNCKGQNNKSTLRHFVMLNTLTVIAVCWNSKRQNQITDNNTSDCLDGIIL